MNLLLHGLKSPQIAYGNSLAGKLTEIGKRDRVDVILTNPPFGGEEEAGIRTNFRLTSKLPKRPCCSSNSLCGSCGGLAKDRRKVAGPGWSFPMGHFSGMASVPGSSMSC